MISKKYCKALKYYVTAAKETISLQYRIGKTIFSFLAVIGGKLYSNHPKKTNNVHKDAKYLVSVIITLVTNIIERYTMFHDVEKMKDLGNKSYVLKH